MDTKAIEHAVGNVQEKEGWYTPLANLRQALNFGTKAEVTAAKKAVEKYGAAHGGQNVIVDEWLAAKEGEF